MRRFLQLFALILAGIPALAQVQTVGDVSFAVPQGWAYQSGNGFGLMAYKEGDRFWAITVCASMPSTGNADADFKTAWTRVVLTMPDYKGVPGYSPTAPTRTSATRASITTAPACRIPLIRACTFCKPENAGFR